MLDPRPRWGEVGIHGIHRLRQWDAVQAVGESEYEGDELLFVALPDGEAVIERAEPGGSAPAGTVAFAAALRRDLEPPFRAHAVRTSSGWAVAGRKIETAELPIEGEELTFSVSGGARSLEVDGRPSFAALDALERLANGRFAEYVVQGRRLRGSLWEVRVGPL